jgi:hypothetical protein
MTDGKIDSRDVLVYVTYKGKTMIATVVLVSPNGLSAMIKFDGMAGGYLGLMPIGFRDGAYRDLIDELPLVVTPFPS